MLLLTLSDYCPKIAASPKFTASPRITAILNITVNPALSLLK